MNNNTKLYINTIDALARHKGFYSYLSRELHNAINENSYIIDDLDKDLPKFNDSLDVVFYLEQ